jgi:hypothetical protein
LEGVGRNHEKDPRHIEKFEKIENIENYFFKTMSGNGAQNRQNKRKNIEKY